LCAQSPTPTQAATARVTIPATPAGTALKAWLEAFNSGEKAQMDAYYKKYEPTKSADDQMGFRNSTGGFELLEIQKSEPLHIEFLVKERKSETTALGRLDAKAGDAVGVTAFGLRAIPKGATVADFTVDAAERARVIDGAIANLNEYYVFPETAKKMADAVRARLQRGEYDSVSNGDTFAGLLTQHFQDVSHDKHLRVNFSPAKLPDRPPGPNPDADAAYRKEMERVHCGFSPVQRLAGNIGYLKFNFFADPDICGPTATAAMDSLAGVSALIIDLRENGGGSPKMVAYMCSYLFSKPTHLNDLWERKGNKTTEYWTLDVPGKRFDTTPVFLLTSKRTFSGAEEFSYNLQNLKRATIVGETTGGGAHPVSGHRVDEHFMIGVPFARAINPISKTNWEGVGVEPEVKVPAAEALTTAQKLAAAKPNSK
jgi:hypothetical protein